MTRSKWKGNYINPRIFNSDDVVSEKLLPAKYAKKKIYYFIWDRGSTIPQFFLNKRICVHNGRKFLSFIVKKDMINHKFGEFSLPKILGKKIHINKKKSKKK